MELSNFKKEDSSKSLFRKTILKISPMGDFQAQTNFDLRNWIVLDKDESSSNMLLWINVMKAGFGKPSDDNFRAPFTASLNIDLANKEILETLEKVISIVKDRKN